MKISHFNLFAVAVIGLGTWMAGTAPATSIIYDDSFSRTGTLNGTSPDVVNTGSATWTAGTGATTDGTQADDGAYTSAFLPFTPGSFNIYTLSVDLNISGNNGNWEAMGFSPTNNVANSGVVGNAFFQANSLVGPWVLHSNTGADTSFIGTGTNGSTNFATNLTGQQNYEIVLNTMNPLHWVVTFERNGIAQGTPYTFATNTTIDYVGFGNTADAGFVDNFTLTQLPEPSSIALLGLATVGLLLAARRRRAG